MSRSIANLRLFLDVLREQNELVEIDAPVSADQEIPEIHRCVAAADGPALIFRNVEGSDFPVLTNMFGTLKRVELAFGTRPKEFVERAVHLAETIMPPTPKKIMEAIPLGLEGLRVGQKRKRRGATLEVIDRSPDLTKLPLLKLWPEDGGHFVTLPLVMTRSPIDNKPNLGMYRMMRHDATSTGLHWQIGKGGGFHHHEAEQRGEDLPVMVTLGGPPALVLGAIAPLPEGIPEIMLASLMLGERLPVTKNPLDGHPSPLFTEAEFSLIGHVKNGERKPEGPFGDHYGYYSLEHDYPVFHCDAIARRADAIYPATVVGKPRQEDYYIGEYLQDLLSPIFPLVMPSVIDLWSYGETGFHSLSAAVVKDRYKREALVSAFRILGEGQLSLTKFLLLTDKPVDLKDFPALLEHLLERCQFETDLYIFSNTSMDTLDYAGPKVNEGSKGVLLGLGDPIRDLPTAWEGGDPPNGLRALEVFCPGCLVVSGPTYEDDKEFAAHLAEQLGQHEHGQHWPLVLLCDNAEQAAASSINFLWTAFTRFDPASDIHHAAKTDIVRKHLRYTHPIVIDARMKPWYPKEVAADPAIAKKVTDRWSDYFPDGTVEQGSSELGHLDA
jgi:UbiD family decarboxylase